VNVGDVIDGKYELVRMLGEGGMGRVFAARHTVLGAMVAIKILKRGAVNDSDVARRFLREARAAVRLRSEHVAKVIDVGQLPGGEPFMVMELLEGTDLATLLRSGAFPPDRAARCVIEACDGIGEAHRHGIIHRDVKPSNLFLTTLAGGATIIKVLDFGIATAADDDVDRGMTTTSSLLGSPMYMSPEQLRSSKQVDARSDVWSLGVTLYELVSGKHPFGGPTFTALSIAIAIEPHVPLTDAPPELVAIVERCLAKEPEDRYATVAELADALSRFVVAAGGTTAELSGEYRPRRAATARRRRLWPVLVSVCVVGGAGVVALAMTRGEATPRPRVAAPVAPAVAIPDAGVAYSPPVDAAEPPPVADAEPARAAPRPRHTAKRPATSESTAAAAPPAPVPAPAPPITAPPPVDAAPAPARCKPSDVRCGL
jgi:eukaryotic-like serine/threonine-protein kinase